jgi:hypothetical protein
VKEPFFLNRKSFCLEIGMSCSVDSAYHFMLFKCCIFRSEQILKSYQNPVFKALNFSFFSWSATRKWKEGASSYS